MQKITPYFTLALNKYFNILYMFAEFKLLRPTSIRYKMGMAKYAIEIDSQD